MSAISAGERQSSARARRASARSSGARQPGTVRERLRSTSIAG